MMQARTQYQHIRQLPTSRTGSSVQHHCTQLSMPSMSLLAYDEAKQEVPNTQSSDRIHQR